MITMKNIILIIFSLVVLNANAGNGIAVKALVSNPHCYGSSTGSIQLSVDGGVAPYTFSWNHSLPATSSQTNLPAGAYQVTVTDNASNQTVAKIQVNDAKQIIINTNVKDVSTQNGNDGEINIQVIGGTPGYSFVWNNSSTNQNIWDQTAGNYSVVVTDASGCTATTSAVIHQMVMLPSNDQTYSMQNTNEEQQQKAKSSPTGVEEVNNNNLVVYPIPANNTFNVKGLDSQSQITLMNYVGQVIETKNANTAETQLNVSNVPAGNYIMVIKTGDVTTNRMVSVIK
jgi:hypothetical protein